MAAKGRAKDEATAFLKNIKASKTPSPCYLLHGEETFLLDLALRAVMDVALPGGINDFNFDQFYGREVVGDKVVSACETLALFGGRRLVLIRELQFAPSNQLHAIADYLKNPAPMTVLVCHAQTRAKKLNKNTKFFKQARKAGVVQAFDPLREWEVGRFMVIQAKKRGLRLLPETEGALVKAVGTDLATLDSALEKIDLYLGPDPEGKVRQVEADILHEVVATTRTREIWDLTDAVASRDLNASLGLLELMLEQGQSGVGINMMVARHFRQLWQVKTALGRGMGKNEIARSVGMNPYFVDRFRKSAGKFKSIELRRIQRVLLETDRRLKSSRLSDHLLLSRMVLAVCQGGAGV